MGRCAAKADTRLWYAGDYLQECAATSHPSPASCPKDAVTPVPPAQPVALPGEDVLEQVGKLVGNAGYRGPEAFALVQAASAVAGEEWS